MYKIPANINNIYIIEKDYLYYNKLKEFLIHIKIFLESM